MIFRAIAMCLCLAPVITVCRAQSDYLRYGKPIARGAADPAITRALTIIDASRIDQTIKTLVRFNTRNSLSSMEPDLPAGTGIDAAADWIASEFESISKSCGGCLEVKRDTFVADPASAAGTSWANRIPKPTRMTNVYAILRGSDPAEPTDVPGHRPL